MFINKLEYVISEKSASLANINKYVFITKKEINKIFLKQYFKMRFGVDVLKVNSTNYKGKKRTRGRIVGKDNSYKKVYVTLKPGQELKDLKDIY
ncbi:MAG: 50S ribosomal protein L23 [Candidatus Margulisiibacteriota bacterium]|jgi:large subunit ribosomal protein L23